MEYGSILCQAVPLSQSPFLSTTVSFEAITLDAHNSRSHTQDLLVEASACQRLYIENTSAQFMLFTPFVFTLEDIKKDIK